MKSSRGFTLFELLVVLGIISLLIAATIPALSLIQSVSLSNEVEIVSSELKKARQRAISENRILEVRLYSYQRENSNEIRAIRAIQTLERTDSGIFSAITPMIQLADSVLISEDPDITRIGPSKTPFSREEERLPAGATYRSFQFRPAGTTNLDLSENWYFTLHLETNTESPPSNFATILIEPLTGAIRVVRP